MGWALGAFRLLSLDHGLYFEAYSKWPLILGYLALQVEVCGLVPTVSPKISSRLQESHVTVLVPGL